MSRGGVVEEGVGTWVEGGEEWLKMVWLCEGERGVMGFVECLGVLEEG